MPSHDTVPSALPHVSRRRVLLGAAALAALGATATACGSTAAPPDTTALVAQLDRARADSQLAAGAATTAVADVAEALTAVSSERTAHAQALTDEITRVTGTAPATSSAASTSATATGGPIPPPTPQAVVAALEQSAASAAQAAAAQTGYAAGLLGSISASCAAARTVALVGVPS